MLHSILNLVMFVSILTLAPFVFMKKTVGKYDTLVVVVVAVLGLSACVALWSMQ